MQICCRWADPGQTLWRSAGLRVMSLGMPIQGWLSVARAPEMLQRAARASPVVGRDFSASSNSSSHLMRSTELLGCLLLNMAVLPEG